MRLGNEAERAQWSLAQRVTLRILEHYQNKLGTLGSLLSQADVALPAAAEPAELIRQLTSRDLARTAARAMIVLAARDSQLSGRRELSLVHWRMILYSLAGARTLRAAIYRCVECFEAIDWRCGRMALTTRADHAELSLDSLREPGRTTLGCLIDIFGLTQIHGLLSWLIGRPIGVRYVSLTHDEEIVRSLRLPELPFAMRLAADWTGFAFDAALLDYPVIRTADELASRPPESLLFGEAWDRTAPADVAGQVRRTTLRALQELQRLPRFDDLAAALQVSDATLRRRLARDGTNYRQIRESCRRELALDLLSRTALTIDEIAERLDYCDTDAFRQAFRDWTGASPSLYRKTMRTASHAM
jgi:AraC-like DNA-binding protein